ncbi:MAG: FtsW/RodA/SpoVE family cell cycle protein, partial [Alphaproteobacteria bacterium]|nr:FtsW/RodA/SpoVE family cell cycle protein [Alphaproteobacteria bacterium]
MNRADRSGFAAWWFTIDRTAFLLVLALIAIGLMLAFAASPAITGGPLTAGDFRYAARQLTFTAIAATILVGTSLLSLRQIKIIAAIAFAGALVGSFLVLFVGVDVLGARRELDFGPVSLQPSEFLKPGFAILAAAILSDREKLPLPKPVFTFLILAPALAILLKQPDVGQTGLLLSLWGAMLFFWGMSFVWVGAGLGAVSVLGFA